MTNRDVSVIIPTYNRGKKLLASVRSVLEQSHEKLEVIVVDDGSTDDTEQLIAGINDSRIHYHRTEKNDGAAIARNTGVMLAKHDIIAFNDSDDLWHPEKLKTQLAYWDSHPGDVLVYCAYKVDLPDGRFVRFPSGIQETPASLEGNIFYYLLYRPSIGTPTMLTTKKTFQAAGGFDPAYPSCEDWAFSIQVSRLGSIGFVDEILLTVEASADDRISSSKSAYYQARCMMLAKYLDDINALGEFDLYAGDILKRAEEDGITEQVKQMMMHYLRISINT